MRPTYFTGTTLAILLTVQLMLSTSCSQHKVNGNETQNHLQIALLPDSGVHVFYFHQQKRCATCIKIENIVSKTLSCYGPSDKSVYHEVLLTSETGKQLAELFDVSYSGLVVQSKAGFTNLTNDAFLLAPVYPDSLHKLIIRTIDRYTKAK
jgi:hypothetical protein